MVASGASHTATQNRIIIIFFSFILDLNQQQRREALKMATMDQIKKKMQAHAPPVDLSLIPLDLITYREFMAAVNSD